MGFSRSKKKKKILFNCSTHGHDSAQDTLYTVLSMSDTTSHGSRAHACVFSVLQLFRFARLRSVSVHWKLLTSSYSYHDISVCVCVRTESYSLTRARVCVYTVRESYRRAAMS